MQEQNLSVNSLSDLMYQVQEVLQTNLSGTYKVVAEIASLSGSKHLYFELVEKEDGQIKAKCRANLWAGQRFRILGHFERMTQETLKSGMKILAEVTLEFHKQYGFSLNIVNIDPSYSLGEMQRHKLETINKLQSEGLLQLNKHLKLPIVLQKIAVISSSTAAGYQDFVTQLNENPYNYHFKLKLFPALVQGEEAPASLLAALDSFERDSEQFDALVILRGGGSVLDLSCFDDFELNYNLAQSSIPFITGIGHERDESVADLVAHTRLKTPTAVAEFLVNHNFQFENLLHFNLKNILDISRYNLLYEKDRLDTIQQKLQENSRNILQKPKDQLTQYKYRLRLACHKQISSSKHRLVSNLLSLKNELKHQCKAEQVQLEKREKTLVLVNPLHLLERGYTLSFINGKNLFYSKVEAGDEMVTLSAHHKIISTIKEVND